MHEQHTETRAEAILQRLQEAMNGHDLEVLVACFAADIDSQQPAHPARNFRGREQIWRNWEHLFAAIPDITATLVRSARDGQTIWAEWLWTGERADGSAADMAGVTILRVAGEEVDWQHFYMEPIEREGRAIDVSIRQQALGR